LEVLAVSRSEDISWPPDLRQTRRAEWPGLVNRLVGEVQAASTGFAAPRDTG